MSKYQEALETFSNIQETYGRYKVFDKPIEQVQEDYKTLQEAIEKANKYDEIQTPKKVKGISWTHEGKIGNCPNCNELVWKNNVKKYDDKPNICACGQKIKWSDVK